MMVVSAGNEGPACATIQSPPALYESVLSVGAITDSDHAASFSSRGPVSVNGDERLKPDLVAPGVNVRSSVPQGYASLPGTSMAGPHVAGVVALLWSIDATLIADLDRTEALLFGSAQALTVDVECSAARSGDSATGLATICACGRSGPGGVPNNVYGWGQVDAWAAAQKLLADQ
jgi:subtilisin family serine protease